jgi:hypothetical protein
MVLFFREMRIDAYEAAPSNAIAQGHAIDNEICASVHEF